MSARWSDGRDLYGDPKVTGEVEDTEADFANAFQQAGFCSGLGSGVRVSLAVWVKWEPRVIESDSERHIESPSCEDIGVGGFIGHS